MEDKELTDSREGEQRAGRKKRRDAGKRHRSTVFSDIDLRQYTLNGGLLAKYTSVAEAAEAMRELGRPDITYNGIRACVMGVQMGHGGFLWRADVGVGSGRLVLEEGKEAEA